MDEKESNRRLHERFLEFLNSTESPNNNDLAENQSAWDAWEKIDQCKDDIARQEMFVQAASSHSESEQAKEKLMALRQELKQLLVLVAPAGAVADTLKTPAPRKRKWTPEAIAELKDYRKAHGTKKAAEHFGVSEAFVRKKLPSETPPPKGYSAFNQRNQ